MHSFILSIFRNNGKYNISLVNISIILILLLSIYFLFFNYKHTYSYGDQAVENIIATSQLDKLIRTDTNVDYSENLVLIQKFMARNLVKRIMISIS